VSATEGKVVPTEQGDELMKKESHNYYRQQFLLSFFNGEGYQEKEVNGFWLVKHWNGDARRWQVAIYTPEAFERYQSKTPLPSLAEEQAHQANQELDNEFRAITT
jgi:hypothetical protein